MHVSWGRYGRRLPTGARALCWQLQKTHPVAKKTGRRPVSSSSEGLTGIDMLLNLFAKLKELDDDYEAPECWRSQLEEYLAQQ